jgi:uncharacterized protein (DUF362 family)
MKRREFMTRAASVGLLGAVAPLFGSLETLASTPQSDGTYNLAAIRGGDPIAMFEKAIEALGGIQRFVKPGQRVLVKPNIGWDAPPERAANTNPDLIGHIVKEALKAGASNVYVFDHTCDQADRCYQNSKIEEAVKNNGGIIVPGHNESNYKEVAIPGGKVLKTAKVHEQLINADVFINVPILKHHGSTIVSLSVKNLMGVIWDRRFYHRNNLSQCLADFLSYRKPDLNIIDGYRMLTRNGPQGISTNDVADLKALIAGTDIVAVDAAATMMFGSKPEDIEHLRIAQKMGFGSMNLKSMSIKRIKIA